MDDDKLRKLREYLEAEGIPHEAGGRGYFTDASLLTLGTPALVIFARREEEVVRIARLALEAGTPLAIRARGSGTAGAALAPEGAVLLNVELVGACDKRGHRLSRRTPVLVDAEGREAGEWSRGEELYARVGAGVTTDEMQRALKPLGLQMAVRPSSSWSTIGGNYATNAGGHGTPQFGTYKDVVRRARLVCTTEGRETRVEEITDRGELVRMGGHQGVLGVVTELDARVAFITPEDELLCAVVSCESADVEALGAEVGAFMRRTQAQCKFENAEFLFVDEGVVPADHPLRANEEIAGCLSRAEGARKMLVLYEGRRDEMGELAGLAAAHEGLVYREVSPAGFHGLLEVRKLAAGSADKRLPVPGFEDIFITEPELLGKVLAAVFAMTEGAFPGRPVGHQYLNGIVIHYRPQALVDRADLAAAYELCRRLEAEIIRKPEYKTIKRFEHGLGLELMVDSTEERRREIMELKRKYDPAGLFSPHVLSEEPVIDFAARYWEAI